MAALKHIVLFGAGKSATVLIDYLKQVATENIWKVTVADNNLEAAKLKVGAHDLVKAVQVNIENETERRLITREANIVISLMPPQLHTLIALDCLALNKNLLTASYVSDEIKNMEFEIIKRNLLFLCELGLDPGIDHMSAMKLFDSIKEKGGKIISFKSHCGGLIVPESDDNPWHYKISWNTRNIVLAGKAGAVYKEDGKEVHLTYDVLFDSERVIEVPKCGMFAYYPNRDSLAYISLYDLPDVETFIRTTLRHPEFCSGWKSIVALKLTDEENVYETNGLTISEFFKQHFDKNSISTPLTQMLTGHLSHPAETKDVSSEMNETNLELKQLLFLGINAETIINKGLCSAADVLQFILETKLALQPADKDMIVMMHEIEYEMNTEKKSVKSYLVVKGEDNLHTAMAKTVGLPLGIAAKLILEGKIQETGLHIPVIPSIYKPVLHQLQKHGITFNEIYN